MGVPREVGLKFRKIGITGKFRSIRQFLLWPNFSKFNMADTQASKYNFNALSDKRVDWVHWIDPQQALMTSAKIHVSYAKCGE